MVRPPSPDKRIRGRRGVALRKRRLMAEPLCRLCKAEGRTTAATVPDHIKPLALGGDDVDSNIRCLCATCHDKVTREEFGLKAAKQAIGEDGWPVETAGGYSEPILHFAGNRPGTTKTTPAILAEGVK